MADSNTVHVGTGAAGAPQGYEVRLVRVEEDVKGVKSDIGDIKSSMTAGFKEIAGQVKEIAGLVSSGRGPNFQLIAICAAIIVPLAGWGWSQLSNVQAHLEAATGQFVSRSDIQDKFASAKEIADLKSQIVQKDVTRLGEDVKLLQSQIVPLSTHQELWAKQADTNKALAMASDENRKALADITAPKDTISRIYKRLDDVEGLARRAKVD